MKRLYYSVMALAILGALSSCRETTQEKTEEAVEAIGEDVEQAAEEAAFSAPAGLSPDEEATQIKDAKEEIDQKMKEHVDKVKGAADDTRNLLNELKGR